MAKYVIPYGVVKDGDVQFESEIEVSFTKKDLVELEEFVKEHNYSPEMVDIPGHMYDKCMDKAIDTALSKFPPCCDPENNMEFVLSMYIPESLLEQLSEDTRQKVLANIPEEMFEYDDEDLEEDEDDIVVEDNNSEFRMEVEDMFFINGRGLDLFGCIESGSISLGDHVKVSGCGKPDVTGVVEVISQGRTHCDHAEAHDEVSLLIPNLTRKDCKKGMVVTKTCQ